MIHGRGDAIQTGDAAPDPGKSFLFCLRDRNHGIPSRGEMVTDRGRKKAHPEEPSVSRCTVRGRREFLALENPVGG